MRAGHADVGAGFDVGAPPFEVLRLDAGDGFFHGVPTPGEMRLPSPGFAIERDVLLHQSDEFVQSIIEIVRGEKRIVQGPHTPEKHALCPTIGKHSVDEQVELAYMERELPRADEGMTGIGITAALRVVIGGNEMESGQLSLKNMQTGEQDKLELSAIIEKLSEV